MNICTSSYTWESWFSRLRVAGRTGSMDTISVQFLDIRSNKESFAQVHDPMMIFKFMCKIPTSHCTPSEISISYLLPR